MTKEEMVEAKEFCISHNIEISFLYSLSESGLLEITEEKETVLISHDQLPGLEKLVRLRYDMDINLEGIEAIYYILQKMKDMQVEMRKIKDRLSLYEQVE